jgi:myo-inositol-1(or 4)-monophosphatase
MGGHGPVGRRAGRADHPADGYQLDVWLQAAEQVVRGAGGIVRQRLLLAHEETFKGHEGNLVTEADRASEAQIVGQLIERFPDHAIVAEEGSRREAGSITWLVDPLDGTNNFAHGFPVFAVNLAAVIRDEVLLGLTYDPLRDELFAAKSGGGASLRGAPLAVSARGRLAEALVATGFPYDKGTNPDNNLAEFAKVMPRVRGIRRTGSAALDLAYVAAGRLDAYWERGISPWDIAPGILLVREAGGVVTDYAGRAATPDTRRIVASNGLVHDELLASLRTARGSEARP